MADLRVGLVIGGSGLKHWQSEIAAAIASIKGVHLAGLIETDPGQRDYLLPRNGAAARHAASSLPLIARNARWPALDIVVNLTAAPLGARAEQVWRLSFEDDAAPGLIEVRRAAAATNVALLEENGAHRSLGRVRYKTARNHRRNADTALREARTVIARALQARVAPGDAFDRLIAQPLDPYAPTHIGPLARLSERIAKRLTRADWTIGVSEQGPNDVLRARTLAPVTWLRGLPTDRFFADPFIARADGDGLVILAEDGSPSPPFKGRIAEIRVRADGEVTNVRPAIDLPTHLSFPFLFTHEGQRYCLPENHESGSLHLYADEDGKWSRVATLIEDLPIVDPVLFHDGRAWRLFCGRRDHDDITHLYLFSASDLAGPWKAHPLNPIKSDVCGARPAGALFVSGGDLFRPAQDCSTRYGGALVIHRVLRLTDTDYAEEPVRRIRPDFLGPNFVGIHTLNFGDGYLTVDGLLRRPRW